uniref:Uncharacterized protein n=1 Tax=Panagrolaimus davidi TaxID=227884 RepID=A0A914PCK2_9BILA
MDIISKEFYDRCPPSYQKVLDDFHTKLSIYPSSGSLQDKAKHAHEVQAAILKFSSCYFTPVELFELYIRLYFFIIIYNFGSNIDQRNCQKVVEIAYFHLHYKRDWMRIPFDDSKYCDLPSDKQCLRDDIKLCDVVSNKICRQIYCYRAEESDLTYPHPRLTRCYHIFERNATHIPSLKLVQRYESMKQLYDKIKANKEDLEKWFKLLLEADDINFVKDTVEYRLGKNCHDVKLWKLYLTFLKEHGEYKRLLETYSKYCRFFLDDKEMKEEYKKDMIECGPNDLPWNNLFKFEIKVTSVATLVQRIKAAVLKLSSHFWPTINLSTVEKKKVIPFDKNLCSTFYDIYQLQQFALPDPMIRYKTRI